MLYLLIFIGLIIFLILRKSKQLKTGIEIYMGLPGAGKTTFASYLAKKHLKAGYKVWSNMPIKGCYKIDLSTDLMKYDISDGLVLIDEAGLEYDSRNFSKFPKQATEFNKLHRHYKLRICYFTQYWDDIDKKIRVLTNAIYVVRKSIIPYFITARKIKSWIGIDKEVQQIVQNYDWSCPLPVSLWGSIRIFSPKLWGLFDSWDRPQLPTKQWVTHTFEEPVKKKITISEVKNYGIKKFEYIRKMWHRLRYFIMGKCPSFIKHHIVKN